MGTKRRLTIPFAFLLIVPPLATLPTHATASDIPTHRPDRQPTASLSLPAPLSVGAEAGRSGGPALDVESLTRSVAGLATEPGTTGPSPKDREPVDTLLPADASGAVRAPVGAGLPTPGVDLERIAGAEAPPPAEPRGDAPPEPPRRSLIPEPASVLLVLTGLIGLIVRGRLRRNLER